MACLYFLLSPQAVCEDFSQTRDIPFLFLLIQTKINSVFPIIIFSALAWDGHTLKNSLRVIWGNPTSSTSCWPCTTSMASRWRLSAQPTSTSWRKSRLARTLYVHDVPVVTPLHSYLLSMLYGKDQGNLTGTFWEFGVCKFEWLDSAGHWLFKQHFKSQWNSMKTTQCKFAEWIRDRHLYCKISGSMFTIKLTRVLFLEDNVLDQIRFLSRNHFSCFYHSELANWFLSRNRGFLSRNPIWHEKSIMGSLWCDVSCILSINGQIHIKICWIYTLFRLGIIGFMHNLCA